MTLPDKLEFGKNSYGGVRVRLVETNVPGLYIDKLADIRRQGDAFGSESRVVVWPKEWTLWYFYDCKSYTTRDYRKSDILFKGSLRDCKKAAVQWLAKQKAARQLERKEAKNEKL